MDDKVQAEVWQSLGEVDADWAVASTPGKKHGAWLKDLDSFYATGANSVEDALRLVPETRRERALDWGSGTGRLSFALAAVFAHVTCVDASTSMLTTLQDRAKDRGIENVDCIHTDSFIPSSNHDFALSLITMQHFPDLRTVEAAISCMVGSLRKDGHLLVELPLRPHNLRYRVQPRLQAYRLLRRFGVSPRALHQHGLSGISMLCASKDWVVHAMETAGAECVGIHERRGTSHQQAYYVARRK